MTRKFSASVTQEGDTFIAQCLEVDVASQGVTQEDALRNLAEALELYFDAPTASVAPVVRGIEVKIRAA